MKYDMRYFILFSLLIVIDGLENIIKEFAILYFIIRD